MESSPASTTPVQRRPVYEDPRAFLSVIAAAYEAAFADPEARKLLADCTATLAVHFEDLDQWFTIAIREGAPSWAPGKPPASDVAVTYRSARMFHMQFWDSREFMFDALRGDVEFQGRMADGRVFGALAAPFMRAYQELTREDAPLPGWPDGTVGPSTTMTDRRPASPGRGDVDSVSDPHD